MRTKLLLVSVTTVAVSIVAAAVFPANGTARAAEAVQAGNQAPKAAQNAEPPEERHWAVLRVGKNREGEIWEVSLLNLPDSATEVRAKLGDPALIQRIKTWGGLLTVETSPDVPGRAVEDTLLLLAKAGIENIHIVAPYLLHQGRIYYMPSSDTGVSAPELAIDKERLKELATANGLVHEWSDGKKAVLIQVPIDQAGKPVAIITVPRMSLLPAVEAKIIGTLKVAAPAKRGTEPVRGVATVRIEMQ